MSDLSQAMIDGLIKVADVCRQRAYAPYSKYQVGAAILCTDGSTIFGGCNVENASYGLTICAERGAIASAVAAGFRDFEAIAIVIDSDTLPSPCGACRQVLVEFNPRMKVILANPGGKQTIHEAQDLLPAHFTLRE